LARYADDFIITGSSKELLEQQVRPLVEQFMSERGLLLSPDKTVIIRIEDGFDFLGQNVRKYCWAEFQGKTKLLIRPAVKSVKAQEEIPPSSRHAGRSQVTTRRQQRRECRKSRYEQVLALYRKGASLRAIAEHFGMHRRTVRRLVRAEGLGLGP
jgi:hypothetical protein